MKLSDIKDPKLRRRVMEAAESEIQKSQQRKFKKGWPEFAEPAVKKNYELNGIESEFAAYIRGSGLNVLEQAITLRLDPPFTSYRPDLVVFRDGMLMFYECKGRHRFREKGIAKVALAAKTYPMFRFILVERYSNGWKATVMTP